VPPTHKFSALANVSALANARSVIIGDASLRPILDVNEKAGLESRLYIPVPDGSVVCVELAPSQTKILLAIAPAGASRSSRRQCENTYRE